MSAAIRLPHFIHQLMHDTLVLREMRLALVFSLGGSSPPSDFEGDVGDGREEVGGGELDCGGEGGRSEVEEA